MQARQSIPPEAPWHEATRRVAGAIRRRVLAYTISNDGGYLSQGCSSAELLATLYTRILRLGPSEAPLVPPPFVAVPAAGAPAVIPGRAYNGPCAPHYDRFIFSPVHYALVLYSTLIEVGRLAPNALDDFNRDGSTVEMIGAEHSPGIEVTSGSLAQALSQAIGIAIARKMRAEPGRVWVMMTDGEFQEGQTWEALAAAAFYRLTNLAVVVDANGQQCDGAMKDVMNIEPLADRITAFGVDAVEVDGHDVEALAAAAERGPGERPLVIIARTNPAAGLPLLAERAPHLHYVRFKSEAERDAYRAALEEMDA